MRILKAPRSRRTKRSLSVIIIIKTNYYSVQLLLPFHSKCNSHTDITKQKRRGTDIAGRQAYALFRQQHTHKEKEGKRWKKEWEWKEDVKKESWDPFFLIFAIAHVQYCVCVCLWKCDATFHPALSDLNSNSSKREKGGNGGTKVRQRRRRAGQGKERSATLPLAAPLPTDGRGRNTLRSCWIRFASKKQGRRRRNENCPRSSHTTKQFFLQIHGLSSPSPLFKLSIITTRCDDYFAREEETQRSNGSLCVCRATQKERRRRHNTTTTTTMSIFKKKMDDTENTLKTQEEVIVTATTGKKRQYFFYFCGFH